METVVMLCEKLWIVMMFAAFFICLKKGWLKKGFYLTGDQAEEQEYMENMQKEKDKNKIRDRAVLSAKTERNAENA